MRLRSRVALILVALVGTAVLAAGYWLLRPIPVSAPARVNEYSARAFFDGEAYVASERVNIEVASHYFVGISFCARDFKQSLLFGEIGINGSRGIPPIPARIDLFDPEGRKLPVSLLPSPVLMSHGGDRPVCDARVQYAIARVDLKKGEHTLFVRTTLPGIINFPDGLRFGIEQNMGK